MKCKYCGAEIEPNTHYCIYCGNLVDTDLVYKKKSRINPLLLIVIILLLILVAVGGAFVYIVYFDTSPVEVTLLSNDLSGNILENSELSSNIPSSNISNQLIETANRGVPCL